MKGIKVLKKRPYTMNIVSLAAILGLLFGSVGFAPVLASAPIPTAPSVPLSVAGYLDFSYARLSTVDPTIDVHNPSGEKPESKLWWNDGFWWGILYNNTDQSTHIYRLNWGTQNWEDTGIQVDPRLDTRADTLWDQANNKLYVLSHRYTMNSTSVDSSDNSGWFYRYTYNANLQTYTLDTVAPIRVTRDKTETMVIDKDLAGRLWVAFVSRPATPGNFDYSVMVTYSNDDGATWLRPAMVLPFPEAHVGVDDIASIIAFGDKVGVMWSNQSIGSPFQFAVHNIADDLSMWTLEQVTAFPDGSDDHINLKKSADGRVFAAVKGQTTDPSAPIVALLVRDTSGIWSSYTYSLRGNTPNQQNTQPILVIDESANLIYLFVSDKEGGRRICYKTTSLSLPSEFDQSNECGTPFIADSKYINIDKATSSKSNVTSTMGIAVLATNEAVNNDGTPAEQYYVHNVMGEPPTVITSRYPELGAVDSLVDMPVTVTFSKAMKATSFNGNFTLKNGNTPVPGTITYDATTRTATYTPSTPLQAGTEYTAEVTAGVKDTNNQSIYNSPANKWTFTTGLPSVQFSAADFSVVEGNLGDPDLYADITVTLNAKSTKDVKVNFATSDGSGAGFATAGSDYTATSGTLTIPAGATSGSFQVPILHDNDAEGNEKVNLTLSSPVNALLGLQSTASLTIIDDDGPRTVQFSPASYTVTEGASATATITVALNYADPVNAVTVHVATSNGTAIAGSDYTAVDQNVTIPAGDTSITFDVPILDDALDEPDETVNLALSNPTSAGNIQLGSSDTTAVLTIKDNDAPVQVAFSTSNFSVNEDAGTATITASLSAPSGQVVKVDYATSDNSAKAGVNYTAAAGTLTFDGVTTQTFTVPVNADQISAGNLLVNLALSNPQNATLGLASSTLTIVDVDSLPFVQFTDSTFQASGGKVKIKLLLSAASGQAVSVDWALSDGSSNGTEDIPVGQTSYSFEIPVTKTVNVTLSNPMNARLGSPASAELSTQSKVFIPLLTDKFKYRKP